MAVNIATDVGVDRIAFVQRNPWWWALGSTMLAVLAGIAAFVTQQRYAGAASAVKRPRPGRPSWVVDRPDEVNRVVQALRSSHGTVSITTGVYGAGGFGKTTIAQLVRADRRLRRLFGDEIYWVTVGRDVRHGALAEKVTKLIEEIAPGRAVARPEVWHAAESLAEVLSEGPRRLVIVDDVWFPDQLEAFRPGDRSARLITTRSERLAEGLGVAVRVDQMTEAQARRVLTAGLPRMDPASMAGLIAATGRWPLLLRLVNAVLREQLRIEPDVDRRAGEVLLRLRESPARIDDLTGTAVGGLDLSDPGQRSQAVTATVEASIGLLGPGERDRLAELAVFAEDELVPVDLVLALWRETGDVEALRGRALCARLADLALITLRPDGIELHDVIRDYLRHELGPRRLEQAHRALLGAAAGECGAGWWHLPESQRYLRDHLVEHLAATDRCAAEALATDPRWIAAGLRASGPLAPLRDLAAVGTSRGETIAAKLGQVAHLLAPTVPPHSLDDVLHDRLGSWLAPSAPGPERPRLVSAWPLPDLPSPLMRRVLTGHRRTIIQLVITGDGERVVSFDSGGTARVWDATTGRPRHTYALGHARPSAAIAPDGRTLASVDRSAAGAPVIIDLVTGAQRRLPSRDKSVARMAFTPDSARLAVHSGAVHIWSLGAAKAQTRLDVGESHVWAMTPSPDGRLLAVATSDYAVRLWDTVTGRMHAEFSGFGNLVSEIVFAPDGARMVTVTAGRPAICDLRTGERTALPHRSIGDVTAVAVSPDGSAVATARVDRTVSIWSLRGRGLVARLAGHTDLVRAIAFAPDGTWLATAGEDRSVRIWDVAAGKRYRSLPAGGHTALNAVACGANGTPLIAAGHAAGIKVWRDDGTPGATIDTKGADAVLVAPDGTWVAGLARTTVTIWVRGDGGSWRQRKVFGPAVEAMATTRDGRYLVTGGEYPPLRIWDTSTFTTSTELTGSRGRVTAVAVSPDGTWVAACQGAHLRLLDVPGGRLRAEWSFRSGPSPALAVAPDGRWIAAGDTGPVMLWTSGGEPAGTLAPDAEKVLALAFSPGGERLAVVGDNGAIQIFGVPDGRPLAMTRVEHRANSCVWAPFEPLLYVAGEGGLYCFRYTHLP
ncbi:NB-ARC domain-containing protein [Actinoplanes sp. CA-131856]